MKYTAPFSLAAAFLAACTTGHPTTAYDVQQAIGVYRGDFSGSEIQLTLEQIDDHSAAGHSLHKGQRSNMKGSFQPSAHGLHFELKELGSSPYEGVFTFDLDTTTMQLRGTWMPLANKDLSLVSYTLNKDQALTPASSRP